MGDEVPVQDLQVYMASVGREVRTSAADSPVPILPMTFAAADGSDMLTASDRGRGTVELGVRSPQGDLVTAVISSDEARELAARLILWADATDEMET